MPRRGSSMFTPSGGKGNGFSFGTTGGRGGSHKNSNAPMPFSAASPVVGGHGTANSRGPVPFNVGRGPGPSRGHVNGGRGRGPSPGLVNSERGSGPPSNGRGSSSEAGSSRGPISAGSAPSRGPFSLGPGPSRSPVTIAQEQGSSSNARGGGAGAGKRTSFMLQPNPGVPLIDFDSDDYSSDDEPQRGPLPPIGGFAGNRIPGVSSGIITTGSATARPMVGGFAAAAYEAAKAHHFATKGKGKQPNPMPRRSTKRQLVY